MESEVVDQKQGSEEDKKAFLEWKQRHPCALQAFDEIMATTNFEQRKVCVFLDYDGTLSPIVNDPDRAFMSDEMRQAVLRVSQVFPTGIISGRSLEKVRGFVQLEQLFYAGSHGLDIQGPKSKCKAFDIDYQPAAEHVHTVQRVCNILDIRTKHIEAVKVEDNKFCCSVHYRNCRADSVEEIEQIVRTILSENEGLQMKTGKMVFEIRPKITWNKGNALWYLLNALDLKDPEASYPIYLGDDTTDEDAFQKIRELGSGLPVLVSSKVKDTHALYTLSDPSQVLEFLDKLAHWGATSGAAWWRPTENEEEGQN